MIMNNDMALYVYDIGSFITNPMVNETCSINMFML